jgi:hypothetical protein
VTAADQLTTWRAEIAAEIEQLEAELKPLAGELADAERRIEGLNADHLELEDRCAFALGPYSEGLAGTLWGRVKDARFDVSREATRIRGNLPGRIKAIEESIAGRRLALVHIDRALEVDVAAEKARRERRKAERMGDVARKQPPTVSVSPADASPFEIIRPGAAA